MSLGAVGLGVGLYQMTAYPSGPDGPRTRKVRASSVNGSKMRFQKYGERWMAAETVFERAS